MAQQFWFTVLRKNKDKPKGVQNKTIYKDENQKAI
jgi:hypothetical protein